MLSLSTLKVTCVVLFYPKFRHEITEDIIESKYTMASII